MPVEIAYLLDVNGMAAPEVPTIAQIPDMMIEEIKTYYTGILANGIDKFFETHWFTVRGLDHLLANHRLCEQYVALIERMKEPVGGHYIELGKKQSLEAHVIWETLQLCSQVSTSVEGRDATNVEVAEGVRDAAKRLQVFEVLITNNYLDVETLPSAPVLPPTARNGNLDIQLSTRERDFWRLITQFCTLRFDENASNPEAMDECLTECRHLLDSRENRDVIYSIAIARHVARRRAEKGKYAYKPEAYNTDLENPLQKLAVARGFIQSEANGAGTTQVAQRICGMAIRSWGS